MPPKRAHAGAATSTVSIASSSASPSSSSSSSTVASNKKANTLCAGASAGAAASSSSNAAAAIVYEQCDSHSNSSDDMQTRVKRTKLDEMFADPVVDDPRDVKVSLAADTTCDDAQLTPGSILYRPARLVYVGRDDKNNYIMRNMDAAGTEMIALTPSVVRAQCESPDQYTETKQVTSAQMNTLIRENAGDHVMKVVYTKMFDLESTAVKVREGLKEIEALDVLSKKKDKLFQRLLTQMLQKGEMCVVRGYVVRGESSTGSGSGSGSSGGGGGAGGSGGGADADAFRFLDADMVTDGDKKDSMRVINLRSIISVNLKNTKYVMKK